MQMMLATDHEDHSCGEESTSCGRAAIAVVTKHNPGLPNRIRGFLLSRSSFHLGEADLNFRPESPGQWRALRSQHHAPGRAPSASPPFGISGGSGKLPCLFWGFLFVFVVAFQQFQKGLSPPCIMRVEHASKCSCFK